MQTPLPDKAEKRIRFGCGALFGVVTGLSLAFKFLAIGLGNQTVGHDYRRTYLWRFRN